MLAISSTNLSVETGNGEVTYNSDILWGEVTYNSDIFCVWTQTSRISSEYILKYKLNLTGF